MKCRRRRVRLFPAGTGLFLCVSFSFKKRTRADASKSIRSNVGDVQSISVILFSPFLVIQVQENHISLWKGQKKKKKSRLYSREKSCFEGRHVVWGRVNLVEERGGSQQSINRLSRWLASLSSLHRLRGRVRLGWKPRSLCCRDFIYAGQLQSIKADTNRLLLLLVSLASNRTDKKIRMKQEMNRKETRGIVRELRRCWRGKGRTSRDLMVPAG